MAGSAKNWLIGCGVGCGLLVALVLGLGTAGFFGVRHVMDRAERLEAASDSLATLHGSPGAWAPPADGTLAASRVEAFLEARRQMAPARERASRTFATLDGGGGGVTAKVGAGVSLVPHILSLIEARDRALLAVGMGPGEYRFLYTVAYFGLLGKDPADGPGFMVSGNGAGDGDGRQWTVGTRHGEQDDGDVRRRRGEAVRESLNRTQAANLRRQLEQLEAAGGGDPAWRQALTAEVAALSSDPQRLAWEQDLPARLRDTLEPFRDRLEQAYDPTTGAMELEMDRDD
ncbi:MAG: hypothetical protein IPK64_16355 [bacterium]|nr:hypothetical protein [bacterium]